MATVETHTQTHTHRHTDTQHTHRHMHMHMQALEVLLWCTRGSDGSRGALKRLSGAQGALQGLSRGSQETLVCSSLFSKTHAGFRGALTTHTHMHACLHACLSCTFLWFQQRSNLKALSSRSIRMCSMRPFGYDMLDVLLEPTWLR